MKKWYMAIISCVRDEITGTAGEGSRQTDCPRNTPNSIHSGTPTMSTNYYNLMENTGFYCRK